MDGTAGGATTHEPSEVPDRLLQLREPVFSRWKDCVRNTIPEASELEEKILTNALNRFYDDLITSLRKGRPYSIATAGIGSSSSHGRERANLTGYGPKELLQELQLLRQILFEVADANHIVLEPSHRSIIARSIDVATLEAINSFATTQKEVGETFIASLSHDLRNPLNVASVSIQLIEIKSTDNYVTNLAHKIRKKLCDIDAMIQTLLDAAFFKGRKRLRLKIVHFDMKALTDEVSADMSSPQQPIICNGESITGYWCLSSMKRVFENLLSNAQKYGAPNTPINLHIEKTDDKIILEIHNEGPPIPEDERHLLFSTFHRFEDINVKGWGLGLPFVRLVTESHGGIITVDSTKDEGTTFKIKLPIDCRSYGN